MAKDWDLISGARKNLELARKYRTKGDTGVATLLYNKAIAAVMRALYFRSTGKLAPKDASIEYLSSRAGLPPDVEEYISSVMETESVQEEVETMEMDGPLPRGKIESTLLYLDGLLKRLLDCAAAYW